MRQPHDMSQVTLTEMEQKVMDFVKPEWYNWGMEPSFSDLFVSDIPRYVEIPMKQLRGVLSSLEQKHLINLQDVLEDGRGKIVYPTYETYLFYGDEEEWIAEDFGVEFQ